MINKAHDTAGLCLHQIVARQAAINPKATAVEWRDVSVTYEELNSMAHILANHLTDIGVERGDIVGLSIPSSIDMIVSMLGVLKVGAAYLPFEQNWPQERKRRCLQDAKVTHVISRDDSSEIGAFIVNSVSIDSTKYQHCPPVQDARLYSPSSLPDDKAYVMFTSGSAGEAKGVVVPHRAVTRLVTNTNYIHISQSDKILQLSSPSFDASTFEIWAALLTGATLVLASEPVLDPKALKKDIAERGVTIMWLTAALFHLIADRYTDAIRPLKTLLAGGDVLSPRIVNKVLDAIPNLVVINGYGPTENTTFTCCHRMTQKNRPSAEGVPIGRPITGTEVFILDESRSPVPAGDVGELFAAGLGVALGYLNGDDTEAFFYDESICAGLIYRTGDLVRENSKHELEFVGRRDSLVKIRGYRVSLDGVKRHILQLNEVVDAAVFIKQEEAGDQLLIAYVTTRKGSHFTAAEISSELRRILPPFMIPDKIILSEILPITKNGKVDKNVLMSLAT